jgi:hypothetical protein
MANAPLWINALTVFLSAFLLFLVQPMAAKAFLPVLGGAPAVWSASMMFFQCMLLAGYAYAHGLQHIRSDKIRTAAHVAVLLASLAALPLAPHAVGTEGSGDSPVLWLLCALLASVGAPFFVLSATGPLLQKWQAAEGGKGGRNPYVLYSVSNAGSFLALFSYLFVFEVFWPVDGQAAIWSGSYVLFAAALLAAGACFLRFGKGKQESAPPPPAVLPPPLARWKERAVWTVYAFVPSSLMLGVTTYLSTDVAAHPFLWIVPLALYLLTFVFAFSDKGEGLYRRSVDAQAMLAACVIALSPLATFVTPAMLLHFFLFFATAMACHGRLAQIKPSPSRLTEFYLFLSIGGALGGTFNALAAPVLFVGATEYPLMMLAALLLRPGQWRGSRRDLLKDFAYPALLLAAVWPIYAAGKHLAAATETPMFRSWAIAAVVGMFFCLLYPMHKRTLRFALFCVSLHLAMQHMVGGAATDVVSYYKERNFFGVSRVYQAKDIRYYVHGSTRHGFQIFDPEPRLDAGVAYYPPVKRIFEALPEKTRARPYAVAGLGAGVLACLGGKGQEADIYEIDPAVIGVAREHFTYLRDCPAKARVVQGDARLKIGEAEDGKYGLIILDAFSSDAIPLHLLTKEAADVYGRKLAEGGVLAFHISNRHMDIRGALKAVMDAKGWQARVADVKPKEDEPHAFFSSWVVAARKAEDLAPVLRDGDLWREIETGGRTPPLWTDRRSSLLDALLRK